MPDAYNHLRHANEQVVLILKFRIQNLKMIFDTILIKSLKTGHECFSYRRIQAAFVLKFNQLTQVQKLAQTLVKKIVSATIFIRISENTVIEPSYELSQNGPS